MPRYPTTLDPASYPVYASVSGEGLSLAQMLAVLRRSWRWVLLPTLAVTLAAVLFVQVVSPRYTAESKILLESRDPTFARNAAEKNDQLQPIDEQAVASQVQVVMSRDLAREAIRQLGLVGNPEFDRSAGDVGPLQRVLMILGIGRDAFDAKPEDRILESYFDHLLVYAAGKSRILSVEFRSRDPELAARAANAIAENYIASLEAAKVDTARYASTWLGTNIDALRARVADAEAKVEAYRAKNGLIGTSGAAGSSLEGQQLGELSSQLSQARAIQADRTSRVKMLKEMIKDGRAFEIPDVANNDLIRRTIESRMALRAQLALESRTLLPGHPRIKELTAQVEDLDKQIKAAAERIVRTLENDAKIASARVESLQSAVQGQSDVVAKGNSSEIQLRALEREAKAQREQLESYLSRYREAAARDAESATPADARIVSRAVVPDLPSFPKKLPIVGFAAVLAFMLSAATVIGRHLLTPESAGARRVEPTFAEEARERREAVPVLVDYPEPIPPTPPPSGRPFGRAKTSSEDTTGKSGVFSHVSAAPLSSSFAQANAAAPVAKTSPGPDRDGLDRLIKRLRAIHAEAGRCVLVVETRAPSCRGEGLGLELARALSTRAPTLAIDAGPDSRQSDEQGLTDLVAGDATFIDVIHPVEGSGLHLIQPGTAEHDVLLTETRGLAISLNAMAQVYDWVICRVAALDDEADGLVSALSVCVELVVIASDAEPDDARLVALYSIATEAGAKQVLVARNTDEVARAFGSDMELRLSA